MLHYSLFTRDNRLFRITVCNGKKLGGIDDTDVLMPASEEVVGSLFFFLIEHNQFYAYSLSRSCLHLLLLTLLNEGQQAPTMR